MNNKVLLTKDGLNTLRAQLDELTAKRDRLITQIEEVSQPDESGEDGLATQLKEELEVVNSKIDELTTALDNFQIINGNQKNGAIQVGSKVKIRISGKAEKMFNIVSHLEADPVQNKISDKSPLGQALLGKKINDEIEVEAPVGKITYKIVSIS